MSVFYHEEPPNPSKRCKCFTATLKDAFSNCHTFAGRRSPSSLEDECVTSDFDDQEEVVSEIQSRAKEKLRRKPSSLLTDSFSWVFSPKTGELYVTQKGVQQREDNDNEDDEREEFLSVGSCFSFCSTAASSKEAFFSVKTNFSRCSSLNGLDFPDFWRRSIIQELCHCKGWPFGLCRKAVLLPPLPKSPTESWTWRKGSRIVKMP